MTLRGRRRTSLVVVLAGTVLLACSSMAAAADPAPQLPDAAPRSDAEPDFLFYQPGISLGVRGTFLMPRERGDLYDFVRDNLTIDKGDFRTGAVNIDAGLVLNDRVSLLLGFEGSRSKTGSEYRHLIGSDGLGIFQETTLSALTFTGNVKVALVDSGRRISRFAWIPKTVVPYVGAGGGLVRYHLIQAGEFVDFVDRSIFDDEFDSHGFGPVAQVFGGADFHVWRRLYFSAEARYVWAHSGLGEDFVGFDGIDLAGFRTSTGIHLVFQR